MKKCILICSFLLTLMFLIPSNALSFGTFNSQWSLRIPQPVLNTATLWACDNGVFPETPPPDYVRAYYQQMSKTTWEVHWVWSKSGVQGEARLLITRGGTLLDVY